ncbi:MAG: hypothetical protein HeimC2_43370 [Candidatus Heimdallarchaeota archaeon LC_2]|nr:MAG: hypothetical protein HeimC2_43370 [Candidatus Heimdallarchaeota archaeon LC_2]
MKTENPFISSLKAFYARSWIFMFILGAYFFPIIMSGSLIASPEVGFLTLFIVSFIPLIFLITFITEFARFQNLHPIVSSIITSGIISWALASTLPFV